MGQSTKYVNEYLLYLESVVCLFFTLDSFAIAINYVYNWNLT